ncbi:MAG: hypothetical protein FJ009_04830 [Chloroflexi bacterium]|nr:hypothetical protein [Chloroflexota bacterium]
MSNLGSTATDLHTNWRRLCQKWEYTKTLWSDSVRRGFEDDYWTPLEKQTQATQREMERLAQVIAQAQRSIK